MTRTLRLFAVAVGLMASYSDGFAAGQIPSGATGQCKDGTYSMSATRQTACRGHQGVKDWYVVAPAAANAPAMPVPSAGGKTTAMPAPASGAQVSAMPIPAAGGTAEALPAPAAGGTASAMPTPTPAVTTSAMPVPTVTASGGGPGTVWVNVGTKVYHCPGSHFYGTTKEGKYMSEADARAMGARPDHNRPCPK